MTTTITHMATDDPQWTYLLAAIDRIEKRLERLTESDGQKATAITSMREDLHRVEKQLQEEISSHKAMINEKLRPIEAIAEKVYAGRIVAAAIFGGLLALSGLLGAWSVIKEHLIR